MKTTNQKYLIESLGELGLSENEARLFLGLLKHGIVKASQLALELDLPKSSTRDMLNDLAHRGYILRHKKKNSYLFSADLARLHEAITKQKATILEREKMVEELMPALEKMEGFESKRPTIEYLEGREALEDAFEDFLRVKTKEVLGYATAEWLNRSLTEFFPKFYPRRAAAKTLWRGLIVAMKESLEETWQNDQKHLRQSTYIPPDYFSSIEVNVYGNTVAIVSLKEKFLVRIRSREVAKAFRNILNLAIRGSADYDATIRSEIKQKGLKAYIKDHETEMKRALTDDE